MIKVFATTTLLAFALAGCTAAHTEVTTQATPTDQPTNQPTNEASKHAGEQGGGKFPDPCKLITKEDAAKTLGEPTEEGVFDSFGAEPDKGGHCEFDATAGNGNNVMITVGPEELIRPSIGEGGEPVAELGDEARAANGILFFRKGDVEFLITEVKNRHDGSLLPGTLFVPLAKIALGNL
ncbi:DUF3558 family protein [Streptomyces sp. SID13031]|uniref:DUF3558 family protein n=1 Tax=Streptomyces sp. SID13031 TaxID=2706046 RepID=UPI0013C8FC0D|nr:DUF3558 family protein [Streptomyces sp. SID13031]NEA30851.1 DUF3558 domain-containing protein [Streptomyces sp. SID13031]